MRLILDAKLGNDPWQYFDMLIIDTRCWGANWWRNTSQGRNFKGTKDCVIFMALISMAIITFLIFMNFISSTSSFVIVFVIRLKKECSETKLTHFMPLASFYTSWKQKSSDIILSIFLLPVPDSRTSILNGVLKYLRKIIKALKTIFCMHLQ